ncbi:MAG TPA: GNAT family N-acetyltransferase [Mesorhizobium sp.]|jgi:RimJ/RimL family protein N-acetyltransferase|uniref:GNAT family N-acetyltransferase n=1 Tax=Mesorhizobium sp. TaxID=1871066 RepID=UPI002DDD1C6F|nr:GNAT family N-acetyltransferase [Mesorhizobium sp.]HEV2502379.1 GNAT family N-acetyltransferase [Mesorhizobium sp.]
MILDGAVETPRLTIRPFVPTDAAALVSVFSDPDVARYVGNGEALSLEDAELWVTRSGENLKRHGYGTGAVIARSTGQLIGWAGFARPKDGPEQIIYGLTAANWGRGFGDEIVQALIGVAGERGIATVMATVDQANTKSIRLLEKRGFRLRDRNHGGDSEVHLYERIRSR